jgi:hypothetical protein
MVENRSGLASHANLHPRHHNPASWQAPGSHRLKRDWWQTRFRASTQQAAANLWLTFFSQRIAPRLAQFGARPLRLARRSRPTACCAAPRSLGNDGLPRSTGHDLEPHPAPPICGAGDATIALFETSRFRSCHWTRSMPSWVKPTTWASLSWSWQGANRSLGRTSWR